MFYWEYRGINIVLSDQQESTLMAELLDTPEERIAYMIDRKIRKKGEKLAFAYLTKLLKQDPEQFYRKYYWRSLKGKEAQDYFRVRYCQMLCMTS